MAIHRDCLLTDGGSVRRQTLVDTGDHARGAKGVSGLCPSGGAGGRAPPPPRLGVHEGQGTELTQMAISTLMVRLFHHTILDEDCGITLLLSLSKAVT